MNISHIRLVWIVNCGTYGRNA